MKKLILIIIAIFIIVIIFFLLSHFQKVNTSHEKPIDTPTYNKKDINHDGKTDYIDQNFFSQNMGCKKQDECWNKQITKTFDGDNPVYVYDLDLNKNEIIDSNDLQ